MAINSDVRKQINLTESSKFVEIVNDSTFPPISVVRFSEPNVAGMQPVSSVETYPKYAVLTYDVGKGGANGSAFGDNSSVDAFGRLRVSQPSTLLDSKLLYDKQPFTYDEVINGTGTSTFSANDSCVVMRTAASGDYVIRSTRIHFNYQPGKSLQALFTGMMHPETNITKRIGLFQGLTSTPYPVSDGLYFESRDNSMYCMVTKLSGTPYSVVAPQSAWNVDRLDGTGPSGVAIDFTKAQLFCIDYEWLGLGRVRFGVYSNGRPIYCHYVNHNGGLTAPYLTSPNQPIRYEIRQTGAGSGMMKQICNAVVTEGGGEEDGLNGMLVSASLSAGIAVSHTVFTPVLAIRFKPGIHDLVAIIKNFELLNLDNGATASPMIYELRLNPTISPGFTWTSLDTNWLEMAIGGTTYNITSPGYKLVGGYAPPSSTTSASTEIARSLARLGTSINGTPDVLVVCATTLAAADKNALAAINLLIKA
jgi:hypothetical protein